MFLPGRYTLFETKKKELKPGYPVKPRSAPGLAATLSIAYVVFMVIAFLVFGGVLLFFYIQSHQEVISGNQSYIAQDAARTVSGFIQEKTNLLTALLRIDNLLEFSPEKRRRYLEGLLGIQRSFRSLVLVDSQDQIKAQASRLSTQASGQFIERLKDYPLVRSTQGKNYISPVYIDQISSEPQVILTVPVTNIFGDYKGYLAAELNLKFMWELVDRLDVRAKGRAYVVDRQGNLIAFSDTARVLRVENVRYLKVVSNFVASPATLNKAGVEIYRGIMGEIVVGTYSALITPDWAVVVEVTWGDAFRAVLRDAFLSLAMFLIFSLLAGLLGVLIARKLASPLVDLTKTATRIAAGEVSVPVEIRKPKEVASLASAFNSMTSQLLQSHTDLEAQLIEIKKTQEALRESEERFRNIIVNANEIIYTLSPAGVLSFVSPAWTRLLGHSVLEVEGKHFSSFVHPEDVPICEEILKKVLLTGQPQQGVNYRVKHKDGTWRWHNSVGSPVIDAGGNTSYYVGIAQDITWNKQAEEEKTKLEHQLFQAQKLESIGRLAGGIAHDFNNMLNVILGYTEMIKMDIPANDPLLRKINEIEQAANYARDITHQLLAFSRKQIISPVSLDINSIIRENQKTLTRLIGEDIDFHFYAARDIWKVRLDPAQLNQIIYNLAINARDAMPDGGKLIIETANVTLDETYCREHIGFSPGNYVLLSVSDNGSGMDRETQSHIFEPFFTTKEVGKGTGLGLATIFGIVKQNGGFINVYSEPGQGTSFHIYFTRITEESEVSIKAAESSILPGNGAILLVEDDEMVRSVTKEALERIGYKVLALKSPMETLSFYKKGETSFVLLITDVVMPGMSGIELKKRIAAMQPSIKVLFMSGYTANTIVHHGVLDKGVHFIQKPFSLKELAKKVREAIED